MVAQQVEALRYKPEKVESLILDAATGIFHGHNPSDCTMALWTLQPLTETCTRLISCVCVCGAGVKAAGE